jgi:TrmH family RNA methyltransferase
MEGARACLDLVRQSPETIRSLVVTPRFLQQHPDVAAELKAKLPKSLYSCPEPVFERLSDTETPQGILGVVRQPRWDEGKVLGQQRVLGIYGEQLRDPANVGTIIRTAAALNLSGLWLSQDSADWFSPKVVRATAGAILTLPVFHVTDVSALSKAMCAIYSAVVPSAGVVPLREIRQVPSRLIVAVGNESRGLTGDTLKASACRFAIPLARGVESLNAAVTMAVASFYLSGLPTRV